MTIAHALKLPYPGYQWRVARQSATLWLLVRLLLFVFLFFALREGAATAVRQPSVGIPALLVWLDRRRYREQLLHANLGASELWVWAISLGTSLGLDLLAELALRRL